MVLHNPSKDGSTIYEHCQAVLKQTGKWPEEYQIPEIPFEGVVIWDWYWQLRQGAPYGFNGPGPLLYSEIEAWVRLLGIELEPKDLRLLMVLDKQYMESWYSDQKKRNKSKSKK